MALGASAARVVREIMRRALAWTALGIALGLAGAAALSQVLASQLYGVGPLDPPVYLGVTALTLLVACGAAYVPARRAARIDPMAALGLD